jgi:hypothetical protein
MGIFFKSFLKSKFSFKPTNRKELYSFLFNNYGNRAGVKLGLISYGLNISFLDERGDKIKTPKLVFTASYLAFKITIFFTSTYNFFLI